MHKSILLLLIVVVAGCQNQVSTDVPVIQLSTQPLEFNIHASGELDAVKSTPITAPATSRRPQTLAWIIPEFTQVKEGDLVARFDGSNFQLAADESEYELQKLAFSRLAKEREIGMNMEDFDAESLVVAFEYELAQEFNIDDPLLYTKIEMIDAADDEAFLEAKTDHLDKKKENFGVKSETEIEVLDSSKQLQKSKLDLNKSSLSGLEVRAPHDGMVVLEKSWDGTLPLPGKAIFPGGKLAALPDLTQMQAKVYVPEVEAIGIKESQPVNIRLHAFPEDQFSGTVTSISQTAQPRERDNPVKYFTITVLVNQKDSEKLLPGQRLDAVIDIGVKDEGITVPLQSIFREGEESWVYLKSNDDFVKTKISTGLCSATQCQITEGLKPADVIALSDPNRQQNSVSEEAEEQA
ncbi:efflux RND transporter periplasmic adaptor subunit [Marinicella sp. W31]|uniref:efflux RND transporter periplasmic adaptor subunit n=1 Tax=Marinicella sp. W31 TaxID=3023713 RepID=UPI00375711DD